MKAMPVNPELDSGSDWIDGVKQGVLMGVALAVLMLPPGSLSNPASPLQDPGVNNPTLHLRGADFRRESPSSDARRLADWVAVSGDNQRRFFVVIDKKNTRVFVFNADATLRGATPVLIGAAVGDDSIEGIGSRPIALVESHERTTPAGRFEGERGRNASGEDVIWVDYDAAVSMHRVRANEPKERRLQRLASPQTDDNRISFGCINVPVDFYETILRPAFAISKGVVYVLPETRRLDEVFTSLPHKDQVRVSEKGLHS